MDDLHLIGSAVGALLLPALFREYADERIRICGVG